MNLNLSAAPSLANRALVALVVAVALCAAVAGRAEALPGKLNISVYESVCPGDEIGAFVNQLRAEPGVGWVNAISAGSIATGGTGFTPSIGDLVSVDAVIALNDCPWANSDALGNTLADFQDRGGVVVAPNFNFWLESNDPGYAILGRWASGGYSPFVQNTVDPPQITQLGAWNSAHPFFAGVPNITNKWTYNVQVAPGAIPIANWATGQPAMAVKGQALGYNGWLGDLEDNLPTDAKFVINAINQLVPRQVTVQIKGNGKGVLNNGTCTLQKTCSVSGIPGRTVELQAVELKDSVFAGWSQGCAGSSQFCKVAVGYPGTDAAGWGTPALTATFSSTKFKLGSIKGKKLSVTLPGGGKLVVKGKGVKTLTKKTKKSGKVKLAFKVTGKTKQKLAAGKTAKVALKFTYTPTGAKTGATVKKTIKLKP